MKPAISLTTVELKNILFMTDFSDAANAAAPYAKELAARFGAKVHALYVRPPAVNPMTQPSSWPALEQAAKIEDEGHKEELRDTFRGMDPEITIDERDLWSSLEQAIEKGNIDMIVMGTRGRTGIGKFLLGSVAERVFRGAPCPVMTVGPHAISIGKPYEWFSRILFATDFSHESKAALKYAISLAEECQAHLTLLHVVEEEKAGEVVLPADLTAVAEQQMRTLVPQEAKDWCVAEYKVAVGPVAETILQIGARQHADLIVMGIHQPSAFPGADEHLPIRTAHKVVSQAECPALTVRG